MIMGFSKCRFEKRIVSIIAIQLDLYFTNILRGKETLTIFFFFRFPGDYKRRSCNKACIFSNSADLKDQFGNCPDAFAVCTN